MRHSNTKLKPNVYTPEQESCLEEVIQGLSKPQKSLPCKLFYDERGSTIFEEICNLDEYYLTRTEMGIMQANIDEICSSLGNDCLLIEFGSGSSTKIRLMLNHLRDPAAYVPIDISYEHLIKSTGALSREYPSLNIIPVCADYTQPFTLPPLGIEWSHKVVFYPGSTIGNYTPAEALRFLTLIADFEGAGGKLLIGVDLKKEKGKLEAAYNDSKGVTAAFNLNILKRLNAELDSDFNLDNWSHNALYNEEEGRIEMHVKSLKDQHVRLNGARFFFREGESILTECSYKYTLEEFRDLVSPVFNVKKVWTDDEGAFSVQFLRVK